MPNLRDYFAQMHGRSLSAEDKLRIYQRFLDKSHRVLMRRKVAYYSKVTAFWVFTFIMAWGAFYLFSPTSTLYQTQELENGLVALKSQNGVVHAEPIGRIITASGKMVITTPDGEATVWNDLYSNDKVLLQAWAEILLTVSNGFQAKIIGPATFMIEDGGMQGDVHIYTINLLEGDYMELAKIEEPKTATKKTTQLASVMVKTDDFHLEQLHADSDSSLDIIISTTTEGKKTITNHGDDILVKKIVRDSEQKIYAAVGEDQTVLVNGDIELIAEDVEKIVKDITDNQLTIRYDLDEDTAWREDADSDIMADAKVVDTEAVSALSTLLDADGSTKQVIDEDVMASINTSLATSFVAQDLAQIQMYYYDGDDSSFAISYTNLTRRLQRVAQILGIEIPAMSISPDSLGQGSAAAAQILTHLEANYYIAPGATSSLRTIISTLSALQGQQFGQPQSVLPEEKSKKDDNAKNSDTSLMSDTSASLASTESIQATLDVDSAMSLDK